MDLWPQPMAGGNPLVSTSEVLHSTNCTAYTRPPCKKPLTAVEISKGIQSGFKSFLGHGELLTTPSTLIPIDHLIQRAVFHPSFHRGPVLLSDPQPLLCPLVRISDLQIMWVINSFSTATCTQSLCAQHSFLCSFPSLLKELNTFISP